jgi:hypothetical protein
MEFGRALASGNRRHGLRDLVRQGESESLVLEVLTQLLVAAGYDEVEASASEAPRRGCRLTAQLKSSAGDRVGTGQLGGSGTD